MTKTFTNATHGRRIAFLLLTCAVVVSPRLGGEELTVVKGSSATIAVPDGIRKLIIGSPTVITAGPQEDGKAALVVGLAAGSSELRIQRLQGLDLVYNVAVRPDSVGPVGQIEELLSDVRGLEIKTVGNKVVLEGKIKTQADCEKVKKVEAAYAGMILNLATFDQPGMTEAVKNAIFKDLHDMGMDAVTVQFTGDTVILDGVVYSDADLTRAVETAKLRMPNVKSLLHVQQVMIETDLQFVEVGQDTLASFGQNLFDNNIVLSPSFSATSTGGRPGLNLTATATYKINTALTAANCRSIYKEHISGASGQEVAFKQGRTIYAAGLAPVPYGVIIKVKPTLQGTNDVLTDLSVEVSTAVGGPGLVTTTEFRTGTSVMSKVGQTVVLSGFEQALHKTDNDKTPLLGDIPLLNLLFANKNKSKAHKEAVLLLTTRPSFPEAATGPAFSTQSKSILSDGQAK
jgi:Flp pilus assembly secretin CpaC